MAFRFKDLMVDVLAAGGTPCPTVSVDPLQGTPCPTVSVDPAQGICPTVSIIKTLFGAICPTLSLTHTTPFACPTLSLTLTPAFGAAQVGAESLALLKQQLKQALSEIEAQERAAREPVLPRTLDEADDLERRLQGALKELQDHKKTLQKPARKGRK